MARLPRLTAPGEAHHVIQRGNNRQPVFLDDADRRMFLSLLEGQARDRRLSIHAYVLMDNHFHLLATPEVDDALPLAMQGVGRRYVRYFNDRHGRSGTLWEGRYRSTLVQTERYLLACMVYIDLNPVRAGLVGQPAEFAWSSYRANAGIAPDRLLTPHPLYWALGNDPFAREQAYAGLVHNGIAADLQTRLTDATLKGWGLGDSGFLESLAARTGRRTGQRRPGRPRLNHLSPINPVSVASAAKMESDPD